MNTLAIKFKRKHFFNPNDIKKKEQFYNICNNIDSNFAKGEPVLLMVTSLIQTKSIVYATAYLALTFSEKGKRVLLVDGNLRDPSLHSFFKVDNTAGLTPLLLGEQPHYKGNTIQITDDLFCLPTGEILYEPLALLTLASVPNLIKEWKQRFDIILFHTSNSLSVPDAQIMANHCDGIILAVMEGRDNLESIASVKKQFERGKHEITGTVLIK